MFNKIRDFFFNQKVENYKKVNAKLKEKTIDLSNQLTFINFKKCEAEYLVLCFQEKVESLKNIKNENDVKVELRKLLDFLSYSYSFSKNTKHIGKLAFASNTASKKEELDTEKTSFMWRGLCAEFDGINISYQSDLIDIIKWSEYPSDAHLFIEWISHHNKIIFSKKNEIRTKLKSYSVELN